MTLQRTSGKTHFQHRSWLHLWTTRLELLFEKSNKTVLQLNFPAWRPYINHPTVTTSDCFRGVRKSSTALGLQAASREWTYLCATLSHGRLVPVYLKWRYVYVLSCGGGGAKKGTFLPEAVQLSRAWQYHLLWFSRLSFQLASHHVPHPALIKR